MKKLTNSLTAILFLASLLLATSCDNVCPNTDETVQGLQDAISTKDKTIEGLNTKIAAKNTALETQKAEFETTLDSLHFSPFAIGLTGAMIGIEDSVLKQGRYHHAKDLDRNTSIQDLPYMIANYLGVDRAGLGKDLENTEVLSFIFNNLKTTLPIALTISGKKEEVKFLAAAYLPYYNNTNDKAQESFFIQYEQVHGKDFEVYGDGEDTSHVATFNFYGSNSADWAKGVTDLKVETVTLQNNYTKWLFVKRHSDNVDAQQGRSGAAWKNECAKILTYLKNI